MTVSPISTPPAAPSRTTDAPATFANKADAWVAWMVTANGEMNTSFGQFNADAGTVNTKAAQVAADRIHVTEDRTAVEDIWQAIVTEALPSGSGGSSSTVTIGLGGKSFTASAGKIWFPGMAIIARSSASAANYMVGEIASYDVSTGALTITVYVTGGSGSHSDWLIYPAGQRYNNDWTEIGTLPTTSGASVTFANIPPTYNDLMMVWLGVSHDSGTDQSFNIQLSDDGSNFTPTIGVIPSASVSASSTIYGSVSIPAYRKPAGLIVSGIAALSSDRAIGANSANKTAWRLAAGIAHIRAAPSAGSFDAGSIVLLGK
jgi:hypothetical protein